jgi:aryl-alcohol dehydrogenase-like predicted oxidoreductase
MDIFNITKLGFGTSRIGGPSLINNEMTGAKPIPKEDALNILKYAYDNGINFYDTSDKYGNAERLLGEAFYKIRDKVVIATKCGLTDTGGRNFSIPYIDKCIESSLYRLKTDYIDIFQLAKPEVDHVTEELQEFFKEKIKEGKIRYFGISVSSCKNSKTYLDNENIKSLQILHNLLFIENEEFIEESRKKNKFVIIRSPLNSGILSGKYTTNTRFDKIDGRSKYFFGETFCERLRSVGEIKSRFSLSSDGVLDFALKYILSNKNVNVVIPAASNINQLKEYIRIYTRKYFNEKERDDILCFLRDVNFGEDR